MSYRMIHAARRLMCDKFSILCTLAELNAKQTKEDDKMSADGRLDKLNEYKRIIDSFEYAGLIREEAQDLLALGFRLHRDSEHMVQVKNEIQRLENVIKKQAKEIRKLKRKEDENNENSN